MMVEIGQLYQKFSDDLGSILIPSAALIFAALAYFSSRSNAKASRTDQLTNLRIGVRASFQEAQNSYSNLQIHCQQAIKALELEKAQNAPKLSGNAMSLFNPRSDEMTTVHSVRRDGAGLMQRAEAQLAGIEALSSYELEARYTEIKLITAQINSLPMRLATLERA